MPLPAAVVEYTDPACPFAWSAEPARRRVQWLYDGVLDWEVRMVGLAATREDYARKGFTPERAQEGSRMLREQHGMPIDDELRPVVAATVPACRAYVAARVHAPERAGALLRALRLRHFGGQLLDEDATIDGAASDAGLDPAQLRGWMAEDEVERALAADMAAARDPKPAALVLRHKLAEDGGAWRYTCPSWELTTDGAHAVAPGFQPVESYEVALANLLPDVPRREDPSSVEEVLAWAGAEPLATKEVAVVCGISEQQASERLRHVAEPHRLGQSEVWTQRAAG
jgi:predicted DsbA family dithiol-disulfide isomerase